MSDRNVPLFDLEEAQNLSKKLTVSQTPTRQNGDDSPAGYLAWPVKEMPQAPVSPPAALPPEPMPMPRAPSVDTIEALLNWGLSITGATAGFVVDPQGFVISTAGVTPPDYFESSGASLSFASEQLAQVDSNTQQVLWLELGYVDEALLAFPGNETRVTDYLTVFVESDPLPRDHLQTLAFELSHRLKELV